MEGLSIVTPEKPESEGVVAAAVAVLTRIYGDQARVLVDRQIEAADGPMKLQWAAIRDAHPKP